MRPRAESAWFCPKPIAGDVGFARAGVRRHDDDGVPEVGLPAAVVGERRVIHHLQQDVVDVRVRLLDLVQQHDAVRVGPHGVDQQAALLEPDVAGRRADQPRHGVLLHVLAHVVADERVAEVQGELPRQLRLADARGPGEQERSGRAIGLPQTGARALDGGDDRLHRPLLAEDDALERFLQRAQPLLVGCRRLLLRDAGHPGDDAFQRAGRHRGRLRTLPRRGAPARIPRPPRRSRRARCRAAGTPADGGSPAARRPRSPRRCSAPRGGSRSASAGPPECGSSPRPSARRPLPSAAAAPARDPSRSA